MSTSAKSLSNQPSLKLSMLVAGIYLGLGILGLGFAIPPGYASPIFPAAGFAAAMMLWSDNRIWAGIWLGSFVLNVGVTVLNGGLSFNLLMVAALLASGATLQAFIASSLVNSAIGKAWQDMELESDIVLCLLLAGGFACVVSASVGVSVLYFSGVISSALYANSWWNWWVGDTLGVLIAMPIVLSFLYRNHSAWRYRINTVFFSMMAVLLVVASILGLSNYWEQNLRKSEIKKQGETFQQLILQRYIAHREAIAALSRLIEVTPYMTYRQFEYFTRITLKDNADIFALSFNPYVRHSERDLFEQQMSIMGAQQHYKIKERDSHGNFVVAGKRDVYVPVGYIAPLQENIEALGFDIYSNSQRREAIEHAIRSANTVVTTPVHLVQNANNELGLLLMQPALYDQVSTQHADLSRNLIGFAVAVLKVDALIRIAAAPMISNGLVYQIDDPEAPQGRRAVFRSHPQQNELNAQYLWQGKVNIANRTWRLQVFPSNEYLYKQPAAMTWVLSLIGLFFTAILQVLMLVVTGRHGVVARQVREQTRELQAKSDALQDSNAQLSAVFSLSPDGFVAISAQGVVQFVNPAFQSLTGIEQKEILHKNVSVLDSALRARAEDPEQFNGVFSYISAERMPVLQVLSLQRPQKSVLQMVGIHSDAANIAYILYLRDVTAEVEVAKMKTDFISHAAHELRTPMTSIFGYIELLLAKQYDKKTVRVMLEAMHRQSKHIINMMNELLDLAKIDTKGQQDFNFEALDINALVAQVMADYCPQKTQHRIKLTTLDAPVWVRGDSMKMNQAMMNVLANAEKYSAAESVIEVRLLSVGNEVGIQIKDQGIGMTEAQVQHVGERFWRADLSGNRPGTGLGMSIVKEIMQYHQGRMEILSAPEEGTTVTLWFTKVSRS